MKKWKSEKHKSWGFPAEGCKGYVAADGSLLGMAGKRWACGWSVVQLDFDEEFGPLEVMCGSLDAALEVKRTIKGAELTAFSMPSQASDWALQSACRQQRNQRWAVEWRKEMYRPRSW